jgi:hypothetical protein
MSDNICYTTASGRSTFRFLFDQEGDRWHAYVLEGPAMPAGLVAQGQNPPGCERVNGAWQIRWFTMAQVQGLGAARSLAAYWAETLETFIATGTWRVRYTSNDGQAQFAFSIERDDDSFRIYIEEKPSYGNRESSSVVVHVLHDGRDYICWEGAINHWNDAEDIATTWAERTHRYITTGTPFNAPA